MTKQTRPPSFQAQSEQHSQEEALRIAKASQRPGQSKEQTRLIAKGIEKGIAEFKKQEKAKARARNKVKKNTQKQSLLKGETEPGELQSGSSDLDHLNPGNWPLLFASVVFFLFALHHIIWFLTGASLFLKNLIMPSILSLFIAGICIALSGWMLYSRSK